MLVYERQEGHATYFYRATGDTDRDFATDVISFWIELVTKICEHRADNGWDRVIFECWCLEGKIVAYPQPNGEHEHRTPLLVVSLPILNEIRRQLETTHDQMEIQSLLALAYTKVRGAIRNTYRKEPARSALLRLLALNEFTCWTMIDSQVDKLMRFDLFF